MPDRSPSRGGAGKDGLAALAVGALAVGCCAGLPLVAALAGSVAAATLLGVGGGILGAMMLGAVAVYRVRAHRRSCETPDRSQHAASVRRPGTTERA